MNTIVAESLDFCATRLEEATGGDPSKLNAELQKLLTEIMNEHGAIIFNGDGYSDEWHAEAEKRGLLNLKTTADALPQLETPEVKALFSKYEVLSERELDSRLEIYLEQYVMSVTVEANLTIEMARTMILGQGRIDDLLPLAEADIDVLLHGDECLGRIGEGWGLDQEEVLGDVADQLLGRLHGHRVLAEEHGPVDQEVVVVVPVEGVDVLVALAGQPPLASALVASRFQNTTSW